MRIAVITEGGKKIGFGHITRCLSLYSEFEKRGIKPCFIVNDDAIVIEKLKGRNIKLYKLGKNSIKEIINIMKDFDCAVVDSYKLNEDSYLKIKKSVGFLASIDDNRRIGYPPGMVINGAIYAKNIAYPVSQDIIYLLGTEFTPMHEEFINVGNKAVKEKIKNILITFGGDDPMDMTPKIEDFVLSKFKEIKLDIIIGKPFRNPKRFKNLKDKRIMYHYNAEAKDMLKLMLYADVAISAGGQTLYELARTGTPSIGICIASNQVNNLKSWAKHRFLYYCGWYDDPLLFKRIDSALMRIQDKRLREDMGKTGRSFIDGRGSQRIAERILEAIS